jgi:hypothetical protein
MDKVSIDFWYEMYIIILPVKGRKNIFIFYMNTFFNNLLVGFEQAKSSAVKCEIYDAMEEYAYSFRRDYSCYDADMYVALYKCAKTSEQRNRALNHIQDIIDEDAFQYHDELIENLRQFVSIMDSLKEEDEKKFDTICMKAFDFFDKQLQWSYDQAMCGQADFIPDVPLGVAERERREVAEIIVSTDMRNLESYQACASVLGL